MPTSTVENYIKQIYMAQQPCSGALLPMGKLATIMNVAPGTATAMVKALADSGLVVYEPREGIRLTTGGEQLALHVLRRHRLLELFLVRMLGLDWSEVHEEAEHMEHVISDKVLERMDHLLGYPPFDPHGDPIPDAQGQVGEEALVNLSEAPDGLRAEIARVSDQDGDFLQFAERNGLTPGTSVTVVVENAHADTITLTLENRPAVALGGKAASKIFLRPVR